MFDAKSFCEKYGVRWFPPGTKNVPDDAIGIRCPYCGDRSNHMHWKKESNRPNCWRCGPHKLYETISILLNVSTQAAGKIAKEFLKQSDVLYGRKEVLRQEEIVWPDGIGNMSNCHRQYLESRNFDPYQLEKEWGLLGTDWQDSSFCDRIIIPVWRKGVVVTYQGRDITGDSKRKYMACLPHNEVYPIKNTLYGAWIARTDSVVVVEGVFDVWRLGPGSVATYGTKFNNAQVYEISKRFKNVFVMYDTDASKAGQQASQKLYNFLNPLVDNCEIIELTCASDPGEMMQSDADYLMTKILKLR